MSDDDEAGINAAKFVFGTHDKHYLCKWHVTRAWKRRLASVQDKFHKVEMFYLLCSMLHSKSETEFNTFQQKFLEKYRVIQPNFCAYFEKNYLNRIEKWAIYCREKDLQTEITTNMHLESFHNKLKNIYFKGKQNRRIDKLLYTLLQMEKHYYLRRLKTLKYGVVDSTSNRHLNGMQIPEEYIQCINAYQFSVRSSTNAQTYYIVTREAQICDLQSCFIGKKCNIPPCLNLCGHLYTCTCPDEDTICKHIHKVHSIHYIPPEADTDVGQNLTHTQCISVEKSKSKLDSLLKRFHGAMKTLQEQVEDPNISPSSLELIVQNMEKMVKVNQASTTLNKLPEMKR